MGIFMIPFLAFIYYINKFSPQETNCYQSNKPALWPHGQTIDLSVRAFPLNTPAPYPQTNILVKHLVKYHNLNRNTRKMCQEHECCNLFHKFLSVTGSGHCSTFSFLNSKMELYLFSILLSEFKNSWVSTCLKSRYFNYSYWHLVREIE